MKLQVSSLKFDADVKLLDVVEKKTNKLDTYFDQIIDGEVKMKLDKSEDKSNKMVEIQINVPGSTFFAKEQAHSFEAATDEAVEALRRQLRKHKGKLTEKR